MIRKASSAGQFFNTPENINFAFIVLTKIAVKSFIYWEEQFPNDETAPQVKNKLAFWSSYNVATASII